MLFLCGASYYTAAPLSLCSICAPEVFSFAIHQHLNGSNGLERLSLFGVGSISGGSLREKKEKDDKYVIPYGDWFRFVSSPHYLAEIVIYGGLLFASGGSDLTIWLLFGFVVANLTFAAAETHKWYIEKFSTYPSERRVILPFVF
ncbi:hypothetical protein C5167_021179 [Papaver somniferum]|uniref:3-oxo-5-alpha-steroid 4-dehydrogenase C-terminal domain-containing protein n=1 Tax=Papaver somniferum TaxID=3469 RepID=A0A4Y7IY77_PAPSO|nr:hypothetical protein C5167_021179 [Papaver somniferum]